jgi:hypothetical protein
MTIIPQLKKVAKSISSIHRPDGSPNVFLFSTPRSGSTWLMELIWSQPGFKYCNEPLNLQNPVVRRHLGMDEWADLYDEGAGPALYGYFRAICAGQLGFLNPNPFRRNYRLITHRIVFKVIQGGENRINWFRDTFNGRIVFLIRHPIAVSLSSELFVRLNGFLDSPYAEHFSQSQLQYARQLLSSGTKLELGVLLWCLQNAVPLRQVSPDWAVVTYEQLILDPYPVIHYLGKKLGLPKPERMLDGLTIPSGVKNKSREDTRQLLEERDVGKRPLLIEKWRKEIAEAEERSAMKILDRFGLDVYQYGSCLPAEWLWLDARTTAGEHECN